MGNFTCFCVNNKLMILDDANDVAGNVYFSTDIAKYITYANCKNVYCQKYFVTLNQMIEFTRL